MNVLILDHHFRQDIEALLLANDRAHVVRTVSPQCFARVAERHFPGDVFDADLSTYHAPELARVREAYGRVAIRLLFDLYKVFPFDLFVSPSDTFFYLRDAIDGCRDLGVPFVVVQKEAGVSAKALTKHAGEMRRWFPFKGDWMTTGSQKSRDFWVASGANRERVSVVGQPRFDYYRRSERWPARPDGEKPTLLFLSYDLDAYDEERGLGGAHRPWQRIHLETEDVLKEIAAGGRTRVLVKPHPQQSAEALAAIARRLEHVPGLKLLHGGADTRDLVVTSDVIVGFQTTALAEAMAAGKRVIYTFWTEAVEQAKHLLLPFHELAACIDVATSPEDLRRRLASPPDGGPTEAQMRERMAFVEEYLGPIDGHASERVWRVLEERVAATPPLTGAAMALRRRLRAETGGFARREARRAARRALVRSAAVRTARLLAGLTAQVTQRLAERRDAERERVVECHEALADTYRPVGRLVGNDEENLARTVVSFVFRRLRRALRFGPS